MRRPLAPGAPVVVKVGSSSLARAGVGVDPDAVARTAAQVVSLWEAGHPTVLVTSGAVAAGLPALRLDSRPDDIPGLQVAAAVGQSRLMSQYSRHFESHGRSVGQILLTRDVLSRRDQYLHARDALGRMLEVGVVPVVNENDTVVVDELAFGDNDRLAAIVSHLVGAGLLILLTDTAGLFSADPTLSSGAHLITAVRHTDESLKALENEAGKGDLGSGGVATKIAAAQMAAWSGIPTVVARSTDPDVTIRAVRGEDVGTWVAPQESKLGSRKLWIAFGVPSQGRVEVDAGAARALVDGGRSLLAVGVVGVDGSFLPGAAVEVSLEGEVIAKGLVGLSSEQILESRGRHSSAVGGEVIHRDDLVVLS